MDIEFKLPLLHWLESAHATQLRQAIRLAIQLQANERFESAVSQIIRTTLPDQLLIQSKESEDGQQQTVVEDNTTKMVTSINQRISSLPNVYQTHLQRFVEETVENLTQLTSYLLTDQLSELSDSVNVMRAHVTSLINQPSNRPYLLRLHQEFCSKPTRVPTPISKLLKEAQERAAISPAPPVKIDAPILATTHLDESKSTDSVKQLPIDLVDTTIVEKTANATAAIPSTVTTPLPEVAVEPLSVRTTSAAVGASFLQTNGDQLDLLCLLLSYLGGWELLTSCSRVCQRWFQASCDPRCFRQITQLRVTQFMEPEPVSITSSSGNEWNWNTAANVAPMLTYTPPTPASYSSLTMMLSKLANLHKLELGPKSPDGVLTAIGQGLLLPVNVTSPNFNAFLSQLRFLYLRNCDVITDEGLRSMVQPCQYQHSSANLATSGSSSSTASSTTSLSSAAATPCFLHRLAILDMSGCRNVTDRGLTTLFTHTPSLRHLDLSYCSSVTAVTLQLLAKQCTRITRLCLTGARNMNDDCLRAIGSGLVHLRMISIEDCWNVTATGILHLANGCRQLRELNCSGTYNAVNESAFQYLVQRCAQSIEQLNFTGCPLTDTGVSILMHGSSDSSPQIGLQRLHTLQMSMLGRMGPSTGELSNLGIASIARSQAALTLQLLDVTGCSMLTDEAVALLATHCIQLQRLNLSRQSREKLTCEASKFGSHCFSIRLLFPVYLGCSALTDASVISIGSGIFVSTLLSLDLSHNYQLTDSCIPSLLRCSMLQELNVKKCLRLTDLIWSCLKPKQIRTLPTSSTNNIGPSTNLRIYLPLTSLDLSGCKVTDFGIRQLTQAWHKSTQQMQSNQKQPLSTSTDNGTSLSLMTSTTASTPIIYSSQQPFHPSFSHLLTLALNECHHITDDGLGLLLPFCTELTNISLVGCHRLTNHTLTMMAKWNRHLRTILLHQCVDITNEGIAQLCQHISGLHELGLDEVSQLSNASLLSIAHHCPHLRRLSMARASHITYHALHTLLLTCTDLIYLNCSLSAQVTAVSLQHPDPIWQDVLQKVGRRGITFLR